MAEQAEPHITEPPAPPGDHAAPARLCGWGRTSPVTASVVAPRSAASATSYLHMGQPRIARGLGRSYGDAAQLANGLVVSSRAWSDCNWLDPDQPGVIRAGAGVTIGEIIDRYVPEGWFVPVTPGTRVVTLGGAIAADIHGKNHHVDGSFANFVVAMRMLTASGELVEVSPTNNTDLFWATVGGMGLTGLVVEVDLRLTPIESSTVVVDTERTDDLDQLLVRMEQSDAEYRFSVAWVDLLTNGRSVLTQGRFATASEADALERPPSRSLAIPPLRWPRVMYRSTVRALNEAWWRRAPRPITTSHESITAFFHPLDAIRNWHIAYGPAGFLQWQVVVPFEATDVLRSVIADLKAARAPAFFAVLKRFGAANDAPLSFPMPGWTLAVDLPAGDASVYALLDRLDERVVDAGGRVYLAKDARMQAELVARMYPRLDEWRSIRSEWDPKGLFQSDLSRRLGL